MKEEKNNKVASCVLIEKELLKTLKIHCLNNDLTMSDYIQKLIKQDLKKQYGAG